MNKKAKEFLYKQGLSDYDYMDDGMIEHIAENMQKYHLQQLTLTDVGCSFSIGFAQYIAKNHYILVNQIGKIHYWRNEEFSKTSEQLLKDYKETLT